MTATVVVERPTGELVTDPDSGTAARTYRRVYCGRGYVRYPGVASAEEAYNQTQNAGFDPAPTRPVLRLPAETQIEPQDRITILTDRITPTLKGIQLEAVSVDRQSQATALRVVCRDWQKGIS
jgi:hypothetical protein